MAFMKALFGTGEAREATKKGARAYDELAARRKASAQKGGARRVASVTKSPKAECRMPNAECRMPNADSNRRSRDRASDSRANNH